MSSISWTLLRVCMRSRHFAGGEGTGGTSGSSSVEQGRLNRRGTGTCYCTMKNSSTCFNRPVFVCSFVCTLVGQGSSTKPSRPTDRELKIRMRIEMGPILIHIRVSMCAHHSVQQPCVSSWEKSVIDHLSKAIYFSDHLPKAKGAGSFYPALRDRFFEMTPPVKDIRIPCRSFVHVCDMYT